MKLVLSSVTNMLIQASALLGAKQFLRLEQLCKLYILKLETLRYGRERLHLRIYR